MNGWLKTGSHPDTFRAAQLDLSTGNTQNPATQSPNAKIPRYSPLWRSILRAILACLFSVAGSGLF
jgi:hypothetical protein